jgi:hypothetical protein
MVNDWGTAYTTGVAGGGGGASFSSGFYYSDSRMSMTSETFKEQLALKFLDLYLKEENICSSDTDEEEIIKNANELAHCIYLYVNAFLAANEGQKIEIVSKVAAVAKLPSAGLLGLK